jgi:tetratricopeptide (TPR) repeat protein
LATAIYLPEGDWEKALKELNEAEKLDPTNYKEKVQREKDRVWAQIHTEAVEDFNEAIEAIFDEDRDSLLTLAGEKFIKALSVKKAKETYNGMIKAFYLNEDFDNVVKYAEDAIDNGIFEKDVVYYYTRALWQPGNKEETLTKIEEILAEHPDFIELQSLYIQYLTEVGRDDDAVTTAEELVEKYPSNIDVRFLLAQIYAKLNRNEEAIKEYEKVLNENPEDPAVIVRIAEAFFKNKNYAKSEQYIRQYLEVCEPQGRRVGYDILWKSLYNQGKMDEAEEWRQKAKDLE